jgi:hypothetical protein
MTITITDEGPSFIDQVRRMRRAQREAFRSKDRMMWAHAKRLEREVDERLEAWEMADSWEKARETRPELFPGKDESRRGKTVRAGERKK